MKTGVTMLRKMGSFDVYQRTNDGMFNATSLLKQWNANNGSKKEVSKFFELGGTRDFIEILLSEENLNTHKLAYLTNRGKSNGGTWMHPYLFVKFAMWINPKFEYHVVKFVYDELIKQRNDAGDKYILLSASGIKLKGYNFSEVAIAMQWIIYGKSGKNLRQSATPEQLKELNELQSQLSFSIQRGFISSYPQLIAEMRKIWKEKQSKTTF